MQYVMSWCNIYFMSVMICYQVKTSINDVLTSFRICPPEWSVWSQVTSLRHSHQGGDTENLVLGGGFPIDSCISLSWINSFQTCPSDEKHFSKYESVIPSMKKKGTSMIVHPDRELFHNKLLHKTLGFPLFRDLVPSLGPVATGPLFYQNCTPFKSWEASRTRVGYIVAAAAVVAAAAAVVV